MAALTVSRFWPSISSHVHGHLLPALSLFYISITLLESHIYHTSLSKMCQLVRASFFLLFSCVCCIQVSLKILYRQQLQENYIYSINNYMLQFSMTAKSSYYEYQVTSKSSYHELARFMSDQLHMHD